MKICFSCGSYYFASFLCQDLLPEIQLCHPSTLLSLSVFRGGMVGYFFSLDISGVLDIRPLTSAKNVGFEVFVGEAKYPVTLSLNQALHHHTLISSSLTALGVNTPDSVISAETSAGGCSQSAEVQHLETISLQ